MAATWFKSGILPYLVKFGRYNLDVDREGRRWTITAWEYRGPEGKRFKVEARLRKVKTLGEAERIVNYWAQPDYDGRIFSMEIEQALEEALQRKLKTMGLGCYC